MVIICKFLHTSVSWVEVLMKSWMSRFKVSRILTMSSNRLMPKWWSVVHEVSDEITTLLQVLVISCSPSCVHVDPSWGMNDNFFIFQLLGCESSEALLTLDLVIVSSSSAHHIHVAFSKNHLKLLPVYGPGPSREVMGSGCIDRSESPGDHWSRRLEIPQEKSLWCRLMFKY